MSCQSAKIDRLRIKKSILFIGPMLVTLASGMIFFATETNAASFFLSINDYLTLGKKEIKNSEKLFNFPNKYFNNQRNIKDIEKTTGIDKSISITNVSNIKESDSKINQNIAVPDVKPVLVYERNFAVPFNIIDAGAESKDPAIEVELLYTEDYGKHWLSFGKIAANTPRQEFFFRSRIEGEHWFSLRTWYKSGKQTMSPAQKLLIRQGSPKMSNIPNFTPTPNSIAPSLSINSEKTKDKNIEKTITLKSDVQNDIKNDPKDAVAAKTASVPASPVSSSASPIAPKAVGLSKTNNQPKTLELPKLPNLPGQSNSVNSSNQPKLADLSSSDILAKQPDSSQKSEQSKYSESAKTVGQPKLPSQPKLTVQANLPLSKPSPKLSSTPQASVPDSSAPSQKSTSREPERLSQLSVPIKINAPRNEKPQNTPRMVSTLPNLSKSSESSKITDSNKEEISQQASNVIGTPAARNKFDTLDIDRPVDSDPLSKNSSKDKSDIPSLPMTSKPAVSDNAGASPNAAKDSSNLTLKMPPKKNSTVSSLAQTADQKQALPKPDSKKLELTQKDNDLKNQRTPAPMNKELSSVPSLNSKTPVENITAKANSQPLTLPPLSARPKGNDNSGTTELAGTEDRTKQLLKIANGNDTNGSETNSNTKEELTIVPGKFKNFSIGQNNSGELMIMVRWFRPEEAAPPLNKMSGTLSIERSESPNGPWSSVGKGLDVNEKGFWWKATPIDAVPFYLRTVCVDTLGKSSTDMIQQRLELASQLRGRVPGLPDDDKIAVRSTAPSPAPSTSSTAPSASSTAPSASSTAPSASSTAQTSSTSPATAAELGSPLDKKSSAHETIRAWKNTTGPFDKTNGNNSPFQNVGFEKSSEAGATVNKTSSVQNDKLNPGYQDLKSYQPTPSPQNASQGTAQRQPQPQRAPVPPPTDPNEYSLNPLFTNGFGILFQSAPSQGENSTEKRSIFTSPQTWRSQNNSQNAVPPNGQNDYNNGGVYNNNGYEGSAPYPQGQIASGNGNSPEMQNPGEVVYLDEKGNRIANPFTNGMTGPNGQQYVPQNGVFVDPQNMPNGPISNTSMPNGQPMSGNYPDSSWQGMPPMNYSNGPITQQDASMQFPDGMYLQDGLPQDAAPSPTGKSYFGPGNSESAPGNSSSQQNSPPRDYSNPQF